MYNRAMYGNKGKGLEILIDAANKQYALKKWGVIQHVEQPVKVEKKMAQGKVTGRLLKSTVDFVGHYKGRGVAFDAKQTKNKTSFPLSNIEYHQFLFLENFYDSGGWAFLIVEFTALNKIYLLPLPQLRKHWKDMEQGGPKSIKLESFIHEVKSGRGAALDYMAPYEDKL